MPVGGSIFALMFLAGVAIVSLMLSFVGSTPGGEKLTSKMRCLAFLIALITFFVFLIIPDLGVFS